MTDFVRTVLGLAPARVSGLDADLFELPDGSSFAVAEVEDAPGERTVGFGVDDLEPATDERAAGVDVDDEIAANERFRYVHFRAPDGRLYELVEINGG